MDSIVRILPMLGARSNKKNVFFVVFIYCHIIAVIIAQQFCTIFHANSTTLFSYLNNSFAHCFAVLNIILKIVAHFHCTKYIRSRPTGSDWSRFSGSPLPAQPYLLLLSRTHFYYPNPSRTLLARQDQSHLLLHQREGCLSLLARGRRQPGPQGRGLWAGRPCSASCSRSV